MSSGRQFAIAAALAVLVGLGLSGCMSPLPPLRSDHTFVISHRDILALNPSDFVSTVMTRAAEATVDHGYRYFVIVAPGTDRHYVSMSAIREGHDAVIKLYSADEIAPGTRGVFDAQQILATGPPKS